MRQNEESRMTPRLLARANGRSAFPSPQGGEAAGRAVCREKEEKQEVCFRPAVSGCSAGVHTERLNRQLERRVWSSEGRPRWDGKWEFQHAGAVVRP